MKEKLLIFLILLVLGGGVYYYFFSGHFQGDFVPLKVQQIKEQTAKSTIDAEYPTCDIAPADFNKQIESDIRGQIKNYQDDIAQNQQMRNDVSYTFKVWWQPKQINKNYLSFMIYNESFTGGANLNEALFAYNYDLGRKKAVTLADLFQTQNYLQALSDHIIRDLTSQFKENSIPTDLLSEGAGPQADNFKNFIFDDNMIDFYFVKGTVAPAFAGMQHVSISRETSLKDNETTGLANPASKNCLDQGGKLTIKNAPNGEYGVCTFTDNRQCEEWALFRGSCPEGGVKVTGYTTDRAIYCAIVGGSYSEKDDNCTYKNKICSAKDLYDGTCQLD